MNLFVECIVKMHYIAKVKEVVLMLFVMFVLFTIVMIGLFYKTAKVPNQPLLFSFVVFFLYFFMSDPGSIMTRLLIVGCIFLGSVFFLQFLGIGAGSLKLVIVISLVLGWKLSLLFMLLLTLITYFINRKVKKKNKKIFKYYPIMINVLSLILFSVAYFQEWL